MVDELVLSPDELGFLIMIKVNETFKYIGKNDTQKVLLKEQPFHFGYEDLNDLDFFEDDEASGVLNEVSILTKEYSNVCLLDVFRNKGNTIIESDMFSEYKRLGLIGACDDKI